MENDSQNSIDAVMDTPVNAVSKILIFLTEKIKSDSATKKQSDYEQHCRSSIEIMQSAFSEEDMKSHSKITDVESVIPKCFDGASTTTSNSSFEFSEATIDSQHFTTDCVSSARETRGKRYESVSTQIVIQKTSKYTLSNMFESDPNVDEMAAIEQKDSDCSAYKKLARICKCLNEKSYNYLVKKFSEDIAYSNNTTGEIIKNLRIVKQFLYRGGQHTNNALLILNEALTCSTLPEKQEVIEGCAHADLCNVFQDESIVKVCIVWPFRYAAYGDSSTQILASNLLHKIAEDVKGRNYLNYNSKIKFEINKLIQQRPAKMTVRVLEILNAVVYLLQLNDRSNRTGLKSVPIDA